MQTSLQNDNCEKLLNLFKPEIRLQLTDMANNEQSMLDNVIKMIKCNFNNEMTKYPQCSIKPTDLFHIMGFNKSTYSGLYMDARKMSDGYDNCYALLSFALKGVTTIYNRND